MPYDINDKSVIITGSAQGIGKCISYALLKKGAKVVISDMMEELGNQTTQAFQKEFGDGRATFVKCDVTKEGDLENLYKKAIEAYGHIDIVVNNAGILNEKNWKLMLAINVLGLGMSCELALNHMSTNNNGKGGVIVNLASVAGLLAGEGSPWYHGSKHAVYGYTRSQFLLQKSDSVRINCICPSLAKTKLLYDWESNCRPVLKDELTDQLMDAVLSPEQVAEAAINVIEDESNAGKAYVVTPFKEWDYYEQPSVLPF